VAHGNSKKSKEETLIKSQSSNKNNGESLPFAQLAGITPAIEGGQFYPAAAQM